MATKIIVKATPQARAALGVEWSALELPDGFSLRYYKDAEGLTDVNELLLDSALPFNVPATAHNRILLAIFDSMSILDNTTRYIECRLYEGAHEQPFDRIYFRKRESGSFVLEFRRSERHWASKAAALKLSDIEVPDATLSLVNVEWGGDNPIYTEGETPVRWIPADYGGWVDQTKPIQFDDPTPLRGIFLEDLRPFVSLVYLLKQGFCQIGYSLEGLLLEEPEIRSWYAYLLRPDFYNESKGGNQKLILERTTDKAAVFGGGDLACLIDFNTVVYDPSLKRIPTTPAPYYAGLRNELWIKMTWRFWFSGYLKNVGSTPKNAYAFIWEPIINFGTYGIKVTPNTDLGEFAVNEERYVSFYIDVPIEKAVVNYMAVGGDGFLVKKGCRLTVQPYNRSFVRGDVVKMKNVLRQDKTLLDLVKAFMHATGGKVTTDYITNTVNVWPESDVQISTNLLPGFYSEAVPGIDVSSEVRPGSIEFEPVRATSKRKTVYRFADPTDPIIKSVADDYHPHSREVLNGDELAEGETTIKNPLFEPTIDRSSALLRRNAAAVPVTLPVLTDNENEAENQRSFNIGPRLVFYYGRAKQFNAKIRAGQDGATGDPGIYTGVYFEDTWTEEFFFASQNPQNKFFEVSPGVPPLPNATLTFRAAMGSDLFTRFYLMRSVYERGGYNVDLLRSLNEDQFSNYNFRQPQTVIHDGIPIKLYPVSVRDFSPNDGTSTPANYIAELPLSTCCDSACSCVFEQCDYFQDFGQYIRQSTLDTLTITSFQVDDIEQLTDPVTLGFYNAVQIEGRAFVTNLIAALESVGVKDFTFGYSRELYPPKPDLRFFTIKRPICQSFLIEISDTSGVMYRYTHNSMEQRWFGGVFGPFGYSADYVSEPRNCITTIEY